MLVLDTERRTAHRSALRYRPIDTNQALPAPVISRAHRSRPDGQITAAPVTPDELDREDKEHIPRRSTRAPASQRPGSSAPTRRHIHPLLFMGFGLVITLLLWVGLAQLVSWGNNELNILKYGNPRTFQIDGVVGGGDSTQHPSHFIAINLHGKVTILEFPASDPERARVLATTSILGPHADQAVVTLAFIDISHNGQPDMLIDIDGVESVLINDHGIFWPPTPAEQQQILQNFQQLNQ